VKKHPAHFSFAAIATEEIPVVEGAEEETNAHPGIQEAEIKVAGLAV